MRRASLLHELPYRETGRGLSSGAGERSSCVTHSPNRRPVGGAQDEGVPLRRSAPPPPPPPAPVARAARANTPGYEPVRERAHDALAAQMFRCERGLCPRNRILRGGSEGGRCPPPSVLGLASLDDRVARRPPAHEQDDAEQPRGAVHAERGAHSPALG